MDAVEFVRNYRKMLKKRGFGLLINSDENTPEEIVAETEKWAAAHPVKTRQSVFLEQFPNAPIYTNTHNVALDPCLVDTTLRGHCPTGRGCDICRREFWLAEVEE